MNDNRENFTFPRRNYPYRYPAAGESDFAEDDSAATQPNLEAGRIHRFVLGIDPFPRPMTDEEINVLLRKSADQEDFNDKLTISG